MGKVRQIARRALRNGGHASRAASAPTDDFRARAAEVLGRHSGQTLADVAALQEKYRAPVIGELFVGDLYPILAGCIDPTDRALGATSQLTHVLQVLDAMRSDGVSDPDLLVTALVHDLGKVLLATGEDPANVVGMNEPVGEFDAGIGFDNCVFQWNHDEFGYSRFCELVPDHVAWLIRYHSVHVDRPFTARLMDDRDREYAAKYHEPFRRYDFGSKSMWSVPEARISDYQALLDDTFPKPISF